MTNFEKGVPNRVWKGGDSPGLRLAKVFPIPFRTRREGRSERLGQAECSTKWRRDDQESRAIFNEAKGHLLRDRTAWPGKCIDLVNEKALDCQ